MRDYTRKFVRGLIALTLLLGCGDDDGGADSDTGVDANSFDAASEFDAQPDTSSLDSSTTDVPASDAGADAAAVDGSAADGSTGDSGPNDAGMDAGPEDPRCPSVDSVPAGEIYTSRSHRFGHDADWDLLADPYWDHDPVRYLVEFVAVAVASPSVISRRVAESDEVVVFDECGSGRRLFDDNGEDVLEPGQYLVIVVDDTLVSSGVTTWSIGAVTPPGRPPNYDRATAIEWLPGVPLEWPDHASTGPYYYWVDCRGEPIFSIGPWDPSNPGSVVELFFVDDAGVEQTSFSPETHLWYDEGVRVDYRTFSGCDDTERQQVALYRRNGGSFSLRY